MIWLLNLFGGMGTLKRLPARWTATIAYRAAWVDATVAEWLRRKASQKNTGEGGYWRELLIVAVTVVVATLIIVAFVWNAGEWRPSVPPT